METSLVSGMFDKNVGIMTKPEWLEFKRALDEIKPIPGFNSQKWLRKVRTQILRETEGRSGVPPRTYH